MLIPCHKLKHALNLVAPAVAKTSSIPSAQNFLLKDGKVTANNLEIGIVADLPEAQGAAISLPHAMVSRFIQHIPNVTILELTADRQRKTTIKADRMTSIIIGSDPKDFPPIPEIETDKEASVDGDRLLVALTAARPITSREQAQPVLTGVCLTFGNPIVVAAGDGFRLSWSEVAIKLEGLDGDARSIVIPATTIAVLEKTWRNAVKMPAGNGSSGLTGEIPRLEGAGMAVARRMLLLRHSAERGLLSLNMGEATITTQLLQGDFPNYSTLIPEDQPSQVTFDAAEAFRVVRMLSRIGGQTVRFIWAEDSIQFSTVVADVGESTESLPATVRGEPGKIAFDVKYPMEYLSRKVGLILMETSTPSSPARFTHVGSPNMIIMPKFVQWGPGEAAAAPAPEASDEAIEPTPGFPVDETDMPSPKRGRRSKK